MEICSEKPVSPIVYDPGLDFSRYSFSLLVSVVSYELRMVILLKAYNKIYKKCSAMCALNAFAES